MYKRQEQEEAALKPVVAYSPKKLDVKSMDPKSVQNTNKGSSAASKKNKSSKKKNNNDSGSYMGTSKRG